MFMQYSIGSATGRTTVRVAHGNQEKSARRKASLSVDDCSVCYDYHRSSESNMWFALHHTGDHSHL